LISAVVRPCRNDISFHGHKTATIEKTHIGRRLGAPDVGVRDYTQDRVRPPPLGLAAEQVGVQYRQALDDAAQPLREQQGVQAAHDVLPRRIVAVREQLARRLGRQEAVERGDVVVAEPGQRRIHLGFTLRIFRAAGNGLEEGVVARSAEGWKSRGRDYILRGSSSPRFSIGRVLGRSRLRPRVARPSVGSSGSERGGRGG
jgi:hypothetical protein